MRGLVERLVDWLVGRDKERERKRQALREAHARGDVAEVKRLTRELVKG